MRCMAVPGGRARLWTGSYSAPCGPPDSAARRSSCMVAFPGSGASKFRSDRQDRPGSFVELVWLHFGWRSPAAAGVRWSRRRTRTPAHGQRWQ